MSSKYYCVRQRVPITFRGQSLRIERTENLPNSLSSYILRRDPGPWETA
jgi:hypothetical protein